MHKRFMSCVYMNIGLVQLKGMLTYDLLSAGALVEHLHAHPGQAWRPR